MLRVVIILLVIATCVGVLMPARAPLAKEADGTKGGALVAASGPTVSSSGSMVTVGAAQLTSGEVTLRRHDDGHFYATVQVNGTPLEFMIDTGAAGIALTKDAASRAGIAIGGQQEYIGEGAGGPLNGEVVRIGRVELGDKVATDMDAVVIDGATMNLLGQAFLTRFGEVKVSGNVMTLR